jgi:hypothetical protein
MRQVRWSPRGRHFGLALLASFALLSGAPGQEQLSKGEDEQQFGRMAFHFYTKILGGEAPLPKDYPLEQASRYYVLRVTSVQAHADSKLMAKYVKDFEDMAVVVARESKNNRDVVNTFAPHLVNRFKEVFALNLSPNRIAIVNAALMLPHLARFKNDAIGDYLATLIGDDKTHDAIRVHAAKGMVEFFPAKAFTKFSDKADKATLDKKKRDKDRIDALLKYVNRPMPPLNDPLQIEALRYVRREVVTALAATGVPAVTAYKGSLEAPVAASLVKVLAKKVQPEPSIHERLEAAIGVCQFTKYVDEYDPKIGIYLVGETLSDIFAEYKRDFGNIALKGKERKPTYLAWKLQSKRLEYAMKDLIENTRGTPSANSGQTIATMTLPILRAMANNEALDQDQAFRAAVQKMRPTGSKTLFKNEKGSMLDVEWEAAAAAEEKEEK